MKERYVFKAKEWASVCILNILAHWVDWILAPILCKPVHSPGIKGSRTLPTAELESIMNVPIEPDRRFISLQKRPSLTMHNPIFSSSPLQSNEFVLSPITIST